MTLARAAFRLGARSKRRYPPFQMAGDKDDPSKPPRNGKLAIPLKFEDALRAALKVKPPEKKPKRKPRAKKPTNS